jgi:hypothetical protein
MNAFQTVSGVIQDVGATARDIQGTIESVRRPDAAAPAAEQAIPWGTIALGVTGLAVLGLGAVLVMQ